MSRINFNPTPSLEKELRYQNIRDLVAETIRRHQIAQDQLTENQFAEVMRQIIASGDITRFVRVDNQAQSVVYAPYAETKRLKSRIGQLEELLNAHQIELPDHASEL